MNNKKPIGIILLIIFLIWGIINTVSRIFLRTDSADILILNHYNITWIGYAIAFVLLILNIVSLYSIFSRKIWGVKMIYIFFALNVLFTFFVMIMSLLDHETTKEIYIQSRTSRGLSAKNVDAIMHPAMTIIVSLAYVVFYTVLSFYVRKKREYFSR